MFQLSEISWHIQLNCKGQKVCVCCSTAGHDAKDCSNQLKCANCDGNHAAFSKECPSWQREKKVQQVKAESGVSFVEARKMVQSQAASRSGQSFAAAASTRVEPGKTQTSCVGTQTDLTWPDSQSEPYVWKICSNEPISHTSPTGTDKLQTTPHPETSTAAPPRPYRKTDRNTTDGKDNTSKPIIRRPPAFVQNPVVTQNKYSLLQEEGVYDNGWIFILFI